MEDLLYQTQKIDIKNTLTDSWIAADLRSSHDDDFFLAFSLLLQPHPVITSPRRGVVIQEFSKNEGFLIFDNQYYSFERNLMDGQMALSQISFFPSY